MPTLCDEKRYLDFYADVPLISENTFINCAADRSVPPTLAAVRARLPEPHWEGARGAAAIACYWKTWELAFANLRAAKPGNGFVSPFIDTAFNDCLFMWDSCFILAATRYGSRAFNFQRTLDNLYAKQHSDGFISREVQQWDGQDRFHRFDPASTGPNIMAWSEWEYFNVHGDLTRLRRVFPVLLAYHEWCRANRSWPDGSYHSCGLACGMDNQPRVLPGENALTAHSFTAWVSVWVGGGGMAVCGARVGVRACGGRCAHRAHLATGGHRAHLATGAHIVTRAPLSAAPSHSTRQPLPPPLPPPRSTPPRTP